MKQSARERARKRKTKKGLKNDNDVVMDVTHTNRHVSHNGEPG